MSHTITWFRATLDFVTIDGFNIWNMPLLKALFRLFPHDPSYSINSQKCIFCDKYTQHKLSNLKYLEDFFGETLTKSNLMVEGSVCLQFKVQSTMYLEVNVASAGNRCPYYIGGPKVDWFYQLNSLNQDNPKGTNTEAIVFSKVIQGFNWWMK